MQRSRIVETLTRERARLVLVALILTVAFTRPDPERYGDRLQVALPLLGLGCSVLTGGWGEYLVRFTLLEGAIHGSKAALGELPLNTRPDGSGKGFPSGHTAAAAFGASALVHDCLGNAPATKIAVVLSAGFVAGSRIEAGKHDIWQVLGGAVLGVLVNRLLRRKSTSGFRLVEFLKRLVQGLR